MRPLWEALSSPEEGKIISAGGAAGDQARLDLLEGRNKAAMKEDEDGDADEEGGLLLTHKQLAELAELINNQLARHWLDDKRVQVVRLAVQGGRSIMRSPDGSPIGSHIMVRKCVSGTLQAITGLPS